MIKKKVFSKLKNKQIFIILDFENLNTNFITNEYTIISYWIIKK